MTQSGCAFLGGTATGALATGAGYEIQAKTQRDKLEDDLKNGRISRSEYEARRKQIEAFFSNIDWREADARLRYRAHNLNKFTTGAIMRPAETMF